jgi:hypothetical protein
MWMRTAMTGLAAVVYSFHASGSIAQEPEFDRTFHIMTVEYRASRHIDRTPYPEHTHELHEGFDQGTGYRLDPPNEDGEWYVRGYAWSPSTIFVEEGDRVRLEFFGVNGDFHPSRIEGYDIAFEVRRGELTHVDFVADRPGLFRIVSEGRTPPMSGQLVVMPRMHIN